MAKDIFGDEAEKETTSFADLLAASEHQMKLTLKTGDKVRAEILTLGKDESFVSTGTLTDGIIQTNELRNEQGELAYKVGDFVDLYVMHSKGDELRLSKSSSKRFSTDELEDAFDMELPVDGVVNEAVNGGYRIQLTGKLAFCPFSQMDLRKSDHPENYLGKKFQFILTQFDPKGRNIVVSRRKLLEQQQAEAEVVFTEDHKEGDVIKTIITRIEKYGAFAEVAPGIEGLIHISEISWSRVESPSEVVNVGDVVSAKILKKEELETGHLKISLSLKQATQEPWAELKGKLTEGEVVTGKVTRFMKFGAFVEILPGIEGLIPLNEMSFEKHIVKSDELLDLGESVQVLIKQIDLNGKRISLSLKEAEGALEKKQFANAQTTSQNKTNFGSQLSDQLNQLQNFVKKKT
jgi:small subunit ribosomal protein S1